MLNSINKLVLNFVTRKSYNKALQKNKTIVHIFHIGKTGGTALKNSLMGKILFFKTKFYQNDKFFIFLRVHNGTLNNTKANEKIIFFVRDPVSRFKSAFYSRKRQSQPKFFVRWSKEEEITFKTFKTPNELAESLNSDDLNLRKQAQESMKTTMHVNTSYWDWFIDEDTLFQRLDKIIFVGTQKNLNRDFNYMKNLLKIEESYKLPSDSKNMHKNPAYFDNYLSDRAIKNLENWYKEDYRFLNILSDNGKLNLNDL